jgi:superfamily II DNA or RNA helicase
MSITEVKLNGSIRDIRQWELANKWINSDRKGIINACPRFGKIKCSILILKQLPPNIKVLIAYPDVKIKKAWQEDFVKWKYSNPNIVYTTFASLKKHISEVFELIIIDEVHLLSPAQINVCVGLLQGCSDTLALTGTLSSWTERVLREDLQLRVIARYPIELAIEEGILPDYEINIVKVPLNKTAKYGKKRESEKQLFDKYNWVANKLEKEGKENFHLKLKMIRVLQKSIAKAAKTIELIMQDYNSRILVFCGLTEIADSLGISSYHSKSTEKKIWEDFLSGKENHMAVCKIGNTGITYTPLNKVIINSFDSNPETLTQRILRCMSLEYDNPEKKCSIWIISSDENIECGIWLNKALAMFDKNKIKYI